MAFDAKTVTKVQQEWSRLAINVSAIQAHTKAGPIESRTKMLRT